MKKFIFILAILIFWASCIVLAILILTGCAGISAKIPCDYEAIANAKTYHRYTGKEVRIVVYPVTPQYGHAEAQALENDGWRVLKRQYGRIVPTKLNCDDDPQCLGQYSIEDKGYPDIFTVQEFEELTEGL